MMKTRNVILSAVAGAVCSALIIVPTLALAAAPVPIEYNQVERTNPEIGPIALNAGAAALTFEIPVGGRSEVTVYIKYTRGGTGAADTVTMACLAGPAGDVVYPLVKLEDSVTAGRSNSDQHLWSTNDTVAVLSASINIRWIVTPLNDEKLKCTIGSTGAVTADDVITSVKVRLGVL